MLNKLTFALMVIGVLGFQSLFSQHATVEHYAGEYSCLSHGVSGLRIESSTNGGHKMVFCKDLILNLCDEYALHKTLGKTHSLLSDVGEHGGPLKGLSAHFTHEGKQPILNIKLDDGTVFEFLKK